MVRLLLTGGLSSVLVAWFFLLALRVPLLWMGLPLTQPELNWLLVGERLRHGFMLYTETWDSLSPLSAGVYALVDWALGRSETAYRLLSLLLVMFQSAYFSFSLRRHELYNDRTHLPALLYGVCATLFYDFYTLSPVLMGLVPLLAALNALFAQLSRDRDDDEAFGIGFYTGLAALFYVPFGWFVVFALVALLLLSAIRLRKFLLLLFGFALPLGILLLTFYLLDEYNALYYNWIEVFWERYATYYTRLPTLLLIAAPLLVLLLLAATQLASGNTRFINYQIRCQQAMFLWLPAAGLVLFFAGDYSPFVLLVFAPPAAFFGTHFFLLVRRAWLGELAFWTVLGLVAFNTLGRFVLPLPAAWWDDQRLQVQAAAGPDALRHKRLLVVGPGLDEYRHNTPATPYLTWRLSRRHFEHLDSYATVLELYTNFVQDPPDVIVDKQNLVPVLFNRLPALGRQYQRSGPRTYYRRQAVQR